VHEIVYCHFSDCTWQQQQQQQQPFNGPLSGTTRVSRYQKKHSHPPSGSSSSQLLTCNCLLPYSRGARGAVRAPPSRFMGTIIFLFFRSLSKVENLSSRKKLSSSMFTTSKSIPHICISKLCFWGEWHNTPENIAHFRLFWSRCEMFSTISLPPKRIVYL